MVLRSMKRVKWRNIIGLVVLVVVVFMLVSGISWLDRAINGDCVSAGSTKACFVVEGSTVNKGGLSIVKVTVSNIGKTTHGAIVAMGLSPNLRNASSTYQEIDALAPGDAVERTFKIRAGTEKGSFKVGFDIDSDTYPEKEMFIEVR